MNPLLINATTLLFLICSAILTFNLTRRTRPSPGWLLILGATMVLCFLPAIDIMTQLNAGADAIPDPLDSWIVFAVSLLILGSIFAINGMIRDHREAGIRHRENEMRFRCVTEALPIVLFTADAKTGRLTLCDGSAVEMFGHSAEEFKADPTLIWRLIHPEDRAGKEAAYRASLDALKPFDGECRMMRADGEYRWVQVHVVPEAGPDGSLLHRHGVIMDVSERKQSAEALRASESRFRTFFDQINDAVFIHDYEMRFLELNNEACKRLGYTRSELLGMTIRDIDTPDALDLIPERMEILRRQGHGVFESSHRCKDGSVLPVEISVRLIEFQGTPAVLSVCRDLTERKRAQEALERSESHYRSLIENVSDLIFISRLDGTISYVSPTVERLLGYTPEEFAGLHASQVIHADDLEESEEAVRRYLLDPSYVETMEVRYRHKDGSWRVHEATGKALTNHGETESLVICSRDVTFRKAAESALLESESQYRFLAENITDTIWKMDTQMRFTYVTPSIERLLGYKPEELLGRSLADILTPESHAMARQALEMKLSAEGTAQAKDETRQFELESIRKDGTTVWLEVVSDSLRDDDGELTGFLGMSRDMTPRKQAEEILRASEEAQREFGERLIALIKLTNRLSKVDSFDDLCRKAVEEGRQTLSFDRLGFWLLTEDRKDIIGTFGVDETGRLRDERQQRVHLVEDADLGRLLKSGSPIILNKDKPMRNDCGETVGYGTNVVAGVWDGEDVIGGIFADNFISSRPIKDLHCELLALFAAAIGHLCSRKRAEEAVRESELRLLGLFHGIDDAILVHDEAGRILDCNDAACRRMGYTREEFLGLTTRDIDEPEYAAGFEDRLRLQFSAGKYSGEGVQVTRSGRRIPVDVNSSVIDHKGRKAVLAVIRDITERKRAEEQIRKLSRAVEQSPALVMITDVSGNIEYVNPKFTSVTGYALDEVVGKNPRFLKSGYYGSEVYSDLWATLKSGREWRGEFQNRKKNGELYWEYSSISPIRDSKGEISHFIAVKEDITDRKALESQLLQAQKMEAIGQLAAGVAHDFNNLLTGILGNVSMVMVDMTPESEHYRMLGQADKAGRRAAELVKQLLAFGRRSPVIMKPIDLAAVIDEVSSIARNTFDRRIDIQVRYKELLHSIQGDASQMHNVILNLCVNARDALEQVERTNPPPELRITIEAENVEVGDEYLKTHAEASPGKYVRLSITDTGVGMPEDVQKRIFEPFFTTKDFGKGTGLGLAAVYGIVKQHNGWINVYSEVGEGTSFHIYLPALEAKTEEPRSDRSSRSIPRGTETILLVDDEEVIQNLGRAVLERLGYTVLVGKDGSEGLNLFVKERSRIALTILDLSMPVLSGREVLEQILAIEPEAKVILSSGYGFESQGGSSEQLGASGFVAKPYRLTDLAHTVREVLDGPGAGQKESRDAGNRSTTP